MIGYFIGRTVCKRTSEPVTYSLMRLFYVLIVVLGSLLITLTSYANHRCPTLYVGDRVTVQNVGDIGLIVRETAGGNQVDEARVFDGAQGTIRKGPKPWQHHIWYEIKWDVPIDGDGENWSAGLIMQKKGDSLQTLRLHQEGAEARAARRNRDKQRREIASRLFRIPHNDINYDYNGYACHPENVGGYRGGHSGWDAQTKNVAMTESADMPFYSLTAGTVRRVEEGDPDTLSVIAVHSDDDFNPDGMTTLYLHAREIFVYPGQEISVGDCLGIQGNAGLWRLATKPERDVYLSNINEDLTTQQERKENYREHVHIEVRKGKMNFSADGAGVSQLGDYPTIDPIPYLHNSIETAVENRLDPPDVNQDGRVNNTDFQLVLKNRGKNNRKYDVNRDGVIDNQDLFTIIEYVYNYFCAVRTPTAPAFAANLTTNFVIREEGISTDTRGISRETVQQLLDIARETDDGSLTFKRGIALLEELLGFVVPQKTVLLPNYPNPFNPETWIPYQLSQDSPVSISIYDTTGKVIRTLTLGPQPAGFYQNRSRAAYWDGRNALGERVAGGVYFYTLTAGGFTATRKLLILK